MTAGSATRVATDDWDRHWTDFATANFYNPAQRYRHELALTLLGRCGDPVRLVDIGSGQGDFLELAARTWPGAELLGLEISQQGVEKTRMRVPEARVDRRDLLDETPVEPMLQKWATHAICSEVLEHVDDPVALMLAARAYLAPGCRVVVTVPGGRMSAFDEHIGHRRHFTPTSLRGVLEAAGYRTTLATGAGFPFFNLYRAVVIARGATLIDDAVAGRGGAPNRMVRVGMTGFGALFTFNLPRSPWGRQIVAVARATS
jgi:SAM-dependent methyltransferase